MFLVWATLAVAQDTEAGTRVRTGASPDPTLGWVIPEPEKVNDSPALGDVVGSFKSLVFKVYLNWVKSHDPARKAKFWQYNYYEHIIRNEKSYDEIYTYIISNPQTWDRDRNNPKNLI